MLTGLLVLNSFSCFWVCFFGSFPLSSFTVILIITIATAIGPPQAAFLSRHSYVRHKVSKVLIELSKASVIDYKMLLICFSGSCGNRSVFASCEKSLRAYFPRISSFPLTPFGLTLFSSLVKNSR